MITRPDHPKVKRIRALLAKNKERRQTGLYVTEGLRVCSEVPEELIEEIYISEGFEAPAGIRGLLKRKGYETLSSDVFMKAADTVTPQGILFVVKMKKLREAETKNPLYLILEDVQDPGNIGTILRTAEGAGVTAVYVNNGCADIYSPKVVRATMGSLYRVPVYTYEDIKGLATVLKGRGIQLYATCLKESVDYQEPDYTGGTAFLIGNEGNGLKEETLKTVDTHIRIPMLGRLESLNASVAAALVMYEAANQRRK